MNRILSSLFAVDQSIHARIVPPSGFTAQLTVLTSAAMAFLAVFALSLSLATGRLAERWSGELARTSTVSIPAPANQKDAQTAAAIEVLTTTPGIVGARVLSVEEEQALLEPWLGLSVSIEALPLPVLIEVLEEAEGYDAEGLRLRLAGEAPDAVLDDHGRWRGPLVKAANRLRVLGVISLVLIAGVTAGMITLAANAALSANEQVIKVLRLVGAKDNYIARAFVRRFTVRGFIGAAFGAFCGTVAIAFLPNTNTDGGFLTGLSFQGAEWLWPFVIPLFAASVAYAATRIAATQTLKRLM